MERKGEERTVWALKEDAGKNFNFFQFWWNKKILVLREK